MEQQSDGFAHFPSPIVPSPHVPTPPPLVPPSTPPSIVVEAVAVGDATDIAIGDGVVTGVDATHWGDRSR